MKHVKRTTSQKIRIYKNLFTGLKHVYGTYDIKTDKVRQVKKLVTDEVILAHLKGQQSYGVYLLTGDQTKALAVDFDQDQLALPVSFLEAAREQDLPTYIERSKSKGYHVWMFFESPVLAYKARRVVQSILTDMGQSQTEIFPKQDALAEGVLYGNFINAPLFGALVPKGRTVFVDPEDPSRMYPDQWKLLDNLHRISEDKLNVIIKGEDLDQQNTPIINAEFEVCNEIDSDTLPFGLPACIRRILAEGVDSNQRVACFRVAVQLKRNGMPYDLAMVVLNAWAKKNRPQNGKRIITEKEIAYQAKCAYENTYRSVGCEDPAIAAYCDPHCRLYSHRAR